jgi:hypothetical protein
VSPLDDWQRLPDPYEGSVPQRLSRLEAVRGSSAGRWLVRAYVPSELVAEHMLARWRREFQGKAVALLRDGQQVKDRDGPSNASTSRIGDRGGSIRIGKRPRPLARIQDRGRRVLTRHCVVDDDTVSPANGSDGASGVTDHDGRTSGQ